MITFQVPTKDQVSTNNQEIFNKLESSLGFVPNLYATYAYSDTALENYVSFSNAKTSLSAKEKEVVNLAVSQVNECAYCLAAHTAIAGMNGFSGDEILQLRTGEVAFNEKYNVLARLAKNITETRGNTSSEIVSEFLEAGYTKGNLVDVISLVGEKTISNYLHNTTQVPVDFPAAPSLELTTL